MNEQETTQETKDQSTTENNGDRVHEETISELDRADQIAERLKRENDRRENLLERAETLEARRAVGGIADAGTASVQQKTESDKEYAERMLKGL